MDLTMFITSALSAGGGAGTVGLLVLSMYKNAIQKEQQQREDERAEREALSKKVDRLETEKIADLRKMLDRHLETDNPRRTDEQMKKVTGEMTRLADALDRDRKDAQISARELSTAIGKLEGTLIGINKWLDNMNDALQNHINDGGKHRGN